MFERVLTDADATLRVSVDDRQVMIKTTQAEVSSRLVDGAFPKYESVIPKDAVLTATFKKEELLAGMRQAKLLTNEESRSVKLAFQDGKLILTSRATDVGEAIVEVDTQDGGTPVEVAFNPDFVIEGLARHRGERSHAARVRQGHAFEDRRRRELRLRRDAGHDARRMRSRHGAPRPIGDQLREFMQALAGSGEAEPTAQELSDALDRGRRARTSRRTRTCAGRGSACSRSRSIRRRSATSSRAFRA